MITGTAEYTKEGNRRPPSKELLCTWVAKAWKEVDVATITNSFLKCGIANAHDGSEDNLLFSESCRPMCDAEMDIATEEDDCIIWDGNTVPVSPACHDSDDDEDCYGF